MCRSGEAGLKRSKPNVSPKCRLQQKVEKTGMAAKVKVRFLVYSFF